MNSKSKKFFVGAMIVVLAETVSVANAATPFYRDLKQGDSGIDVLALQRVLNDDSDTRVAVSGPGSVGNETDYFGSLTAKAVARFQQKYASEILIPAGLTTGTGFAGSFTRKKLSKLVTATNLKVSFENKKIYETPAVPASVAPQVAKVSVDGVFPERVRSGDVVTITGSGFSPTGNTVILGDGPVDRTFENLNSPDGKTITFTYQPPVIKTMSVSEIESLPAPLVSQIEQPIKSAGANLSDALNSFKNIKSESELNEILKKNGHSFDEMYHHFYVIVKNSYGQGISKLASLYGLRQMPYDKIADNADKSLFDKFGQKITDFAGNLVPKAYAQLYGGGITTGIIMVCTCSAGLMTFQLDYTGAGTGLYVFEPGFLPKAGSGLVAGTWLGGYLIMGGQCAIYAGLFCIDIPGNAPMNPVGYSL